ncbi:hypothetical protein MRB53_030523 [Persea americana]|uniref:Uncharacterized protein n=1 Tax=Persea americana TaxID=3435 RepID=A0ACC2KLC5_PERAE|nr:hypothetical protein MRB53_030523 [Persea americana]
MGTIAKRGWEKYLLQLQLHPLRTKAITAGVLAGISDSVAQKLSGFQRLQLRRLLLKVLFGFAYGGPFGHFLHKLMDSIFKGRKDNKTVAKKVLLEQLTSSPWNNMFFMIYYGLVVEGRPWFEVRKKIKKGYPSVQLTAWMFWPIVGWINHQYMPLQFRVVFHSFVACCCHVDDEQGAEALLVPQLAPPQLQSLEGQAQSQMLHPTRIGAHPLTSFQPQRLQIAAEGKGGEPPAIHLVVAECQLLQHGATRPDGAGAVVAPLAGAQLQLHQTPIADLEILEGGDRREDVVGAAVELELLKGGALGGDRGEAGFGSSDESELPEIGAAAGEGSKSNVDIIWWEEKLVEDEAGSRVVGVDGNGEEGKGEEDVGASARGLGVDGGGEEVDLGEVGEAGGEAVGVMKCQSRSLRERRRRPWRVSQRLQTREFGRYWEEGRREKIRRSSESDRREVGLTTLKLSAACFSRVRV